MVSLEENTVPVFTNSSYLQHLPLPSLLTAANAINFILIFPANGFILWLMVTRARTVMTLEFFSLNLTVSEMLFGLSNICFFIFLYHGTVGVFRAVAFFSVFLFHGRPLFQTCICVERYLAVIHPVLFLRLKSLKYRAACCSVVWLLVLGVSFLYAFMLEITTVLQYCTMSLYLLLFSVKLFCCLSVLRALRKPGPGEGEREKGRSGDPKMKAFKVILIITVFTIISYLPFVIIFILSSYITVQELNISCTISLSIAVMTGFVHPFLYLHRTGKLPCITI